MQSLVCTGSDEAHPNGYNVTGGGHCAVRYPDWMWILQEMVEAPVNPTLCVIVLCGSDAS